MAFRKIKKYQRETELLILKIFLVKSNREEKKKDMKFRISRGKKKIFFNFSFLYEKKEIFVDFLSRI